MHISESYRNKLKRLSGIVSEAIIGELNIEDVKIPEHYIKNSLNPKAWDGLNLKPKLRESLLKIANEYIKYLDIIVKPEKIMLLGSMANYNWNDSSDFDLHIVYDFEKISGDKKFVKDFFDTKGSNWKSNHNITIRGYDVEIYVQGKEEDNKSVGVFNLSDNNWIHEPKKENVKVDKRLIKKKAASMATRIEHLEKMAKTETDLEKVYKEAKSIKDKIKKMRQSGLDESGEFSAENLAFKYLRNNDYLERLGKISSESFDKNLSVDENNINENKLQMKEAISPNVFNKLKPQKLKDLENRDNVPSREELEIKRIAKQGNLNIGRYDIKELIMGYEIEKEHGTVNPTTNVTNDDEIKTLKIALAHLNEIPDYYKKLKKYVEKGVSEALNESFKTGDKTKHRLIIKKSVDNLDDNKKQLVKEFIMYCCKDLNIDKPCCVYLTGERGGPITTTASYNPVNDHIWIYTKNRNMLADPLRSIAHEIRHFKQKLDGVLTDISGEDGSSHENEANSFSGKMIRKFGKEHREIYQ